MLTKMPAYVTTLPKSLLAPKGQYEGRGCDACAPCILSSAGISGYPLWVELLNLSNEKFCVNELRNSLKGVYY